jgi:hypothetical protein
MPGKTFVLLMWTDCRVDHRAIGKRSIDPHVFEFGQSHLRVRGHKRHSFRTREGHEMTARACYYWKGLVLRDSDIVLWDNTRMRSNHRIQLASEAATLPLNLASDFCFIFFTD